MHTLKKRVLCVSEDEDTRELLTALLAHQGYQVVVALSLITALLASCGQTFDLYVIDAQFWGGEGTELCRSIRMCDPLSPIVLLSSAAAESERSEAFDAGATSYILKPDTGGLIEAVSLVACEVMPDGSESMRGVWSRP